MATRRLVLTALLGLAVFVAPVRHGGRWTVPFDLAVQAVLRGARPLVAAGTLALVALGAAGALAPVRRRAPRRLAGLATGPALAVLRVAGLALAAAFVTGTGPPWLLAPGVRDLMWGTLAQSVAVIVPLGAAVVALWVRYGFLELVGTLMRPVMRPLYRLPGRAALDCLTSWVGSYSVGLYLTRRLFLEGAYSRREAYVIATCFSTVSIGFVGVVAQTLGLLRLFPLVFAAYFVAVYGLAVLLVRIPPVTRVPDTHVAPPRPEPPVEGPLLAAAVDRALARAAAAPPVLPTALEGLRDGLLLAASILGTILAVGTGALLLARHTPLFAWLGTPFAWLLARLGLPDAAVAGQAAAVGITEMYIPALLARGAAPATRFFVAVLSISQLVFLSSVGPMMLEMFREIPIRLRDLALLYLLRTAVLLVPLALLARAFAAAGVLG